MSTKSILIYIGMIHFDDDDDVYLLHKKISNNSSSKD